MKTQVHCHQFCKQMTPTSWQPWQEGPWECMGTGKEGGRGPRSPEGFSDPREGVDGRWHPRVRPRRPQHIRGVAGGALGVLPMAGSMQKLFFPDQRA